MENKEIIRHALINALGTAVYVIIIASFMFFASQGIFGENPSIFVPITMLMLFVFSAALTGFLIFGRPIMWYLDNKKKQAFSLFVYTLTIFLMIILVCLVVLVVVGS